MLDPALRDELTHARQHTDALFALVSDETLYERPIAARVSALADVFDALTHKRPYKEAWKVSDALAEIRSLKGRQFDPELTDIFLDLVPRLQREHGDLDEFLAVEAKSSPFIKARRQIAEALKGQDPETSLFEMRR